MERSLERDAQYSELFAVVRHRVAVRQGELIARRGYNCAAVALANKNARVIQALLSGEESYRSPAVPS